MGCPGGAGVKSAPARPSFLVRPSFFALAHGGCSLAAATILAVNHALHPPPDSAATTFPFILAFFVLCALGAFLLAWMRRRSPSMPAFTTTLYSLPLACVVVFYHFVFFKYCSDELPPFPSLLRDPSFWYLLAIPVLATLARLLRAIVSVLKT